MYDQETLFDLTPKKNEGVKETTEIEYVQLQFNQGEKKEFLILLDDYCNENKIDNHSDGLLLILKNLNKVEDHPLGVGFAHKDFKTKSENGFNVYKEAIRKIIEIARGLELEPTTADEFNEELYK